jgi:hypothetical protein
VPEAGAEIDAGDKAGMSKRFLRWVEAWIEENIPPGANPDVESHEARAKRMSENLFAEAAAAGFKGLEIEEERERIPPMVLAAVCDSTDFDIDAYISSRSSPKRMKMATELRMKRVLPAHDARVERPPPAAAGW